MKEIEAQARQRGGRQIPKREEWESWLREMFPNAVRSGFASHHIEFWQWIFELELGIPHPTADAFFAIWSRRGGKTTNGQLGVITVGALRKRRYGWLISRTQSQANDKLLEIRQTLNKSAGGEFARQFPAMATAKVDDGNHSLGWRATRLYTSDDYIMDAIGLDTATRGAKVDFQRPDFMVPDDLDSPRDSALVIEKNIQTLTRDILPAGSDDLAVLGLQNLIHKNGIFARIADGRADFLRRRKISGGAPIPALRQFSYTENDDGTYTVAGVPTWEAGLGLEACQREMNRIGPTAFRLECQHDVNLPVEGALFPMWSEVHSVITWSEFASFFGKIAIDENGKPKIPTQWKKGRGIDRGTTIEHPSGVIWLARPAESDSLQDTVFAYRERVYPEYPNPVSMEISPGFVGMKILDAERAGREAVSVSLISHEAKDWVNAFANDMPGGYRIRVSQWKPDRRAGIGSMQNHMTVIEKDKANPFRPEVFGRSRFVVIVDDAQGKPYRDAEGAWRVVGAKDADGFARFRDEVPEYQLPQNLAGEEMDRPHKIFDDVIDPCKALMHVFAPGVAPMTEKQKEDRLIPDQFKPEAIAAAPVELKPGLEQGAYFARHEAKKELEAQQTHTAYRPLNKRFKGRRVF